MINKEYFGENKNIEFKREIHTQHEKLLKDIIAFSNSTSRPADNRKLQELEMECQNISYDKLQEIGWEYDEQKTIRLCDEMTQKAIDSCNSEEEKQAVNPMTISKLLDFGVLCNVGRDKYPTHAFNLLTDNTIRAAKIQCALFKGITRDVFIDKKEFDGPIYNQIDEAFNFVCRHIDMGAAIEGEYRRDLYELPISAVRESITNAILHRNYMDKSCTQVSIFDDRIEVLSPGMLYGGLDIETAKTGKSTCRNEAIAEAFNYMHIAEAWGTGIPRIIARCREYGLKNPLFEEFGDGFKTTIFRNRKATYDTHIKNDTQDDTQGDTQDDTQGTWESRIINLITRNNKITTAEIAGRLGISVSTVKRKIKSLPNITYSGSGYSGHWEVSYMLSEQNDTFDFLLNKESIQ